MLTEQVKMEKKDNDKIIKKKSVQTSSACGLTGNFSLTLSIHTICTVYI